MTFKRIDGRLDQTFLYRKDEGNLSLAPSGARPFDADANEFKLVDHPPHDLGLVGVVDALAELCR